MDPSDFPDEQAFQDEFMRGFKQLMEEVVFFIIQHLQHLSENLYNPVMYLR